MIPEAKLKCPELNICYVPQGEHIDKADIQKYRFVLLLAKNSALQGMRFAAFKFSKELELVLSEFKGVV